MPQSPNRPSESPSDSPVVDTRRTNGPEGRTYSVPFAEVWDLLISEIRTRPRWRLVHADEGLGLLTVTCQSWLQRCLDDVAIWVSLDENGLTRVDVRAAPRTAVRKVGRPSGRTYAKRVDTLLAVLDRRFGAAAVRP